MLTIIENILSKPEVGQFRSHLDRADWQSGSQSAGPMARLAKNNQQLDDSKEPAIGLSGHILQKLGQAALFMSAALPRRIYPPKFNRYTGGETYGAHVDSAIMQLPAGQGALRSDLAATLFLSEPEDYEGGELEIESLFGLQEIKLAAGDMVLYPASSVHRVNPVIQGQRVAAFFWIESLVGDDGERSLLFELDQTIQGLAGKVALDDRNLLRLTGVYHNLLRRWAST
jgi:PKHD-type hydroxylase